MSHDTQHGHGELGHIVPPSTFKFIFACLVVLTIITVAISRYDFGLHLGHDWAWLNIVVAMVVASIKASLVVLVFMHLKYENPLTWLYAFFPIFLLFILIGGLFLDGPTRTECDLFPGKCVKSPVKVIAHE